MCTWLMWPPVDSLHKRMMCVLHDSITTNSRVQSKCATLGMHAMSHMTDNIHVFLDMCSWVASLHYNMTCTT
jgi:hypothetical protein